jgi:hypothetical protein
MMVYVAIQGAHESAHQPNQDITGVVEHKDKDKAAGLELAELFILQYMDSKHTKTCIKSLAIFMHSN